MLPNAVALESMNLLGADYRDEMLGLNRVRFHSRESMRKLVRECFDRREEICCLCIVHQPPGRQRHQYEGCVMSGWCGDPDGDTLSFSIDGQPFAVTVSEIAELMVTNKSK